MRGISRNITIQGVTKRATEWAKECGIQTQTLLFRYKKGWRGKKLLSELRGKDFRTLTLNGETKTVRQWAIEKGINYQVVYARVKIGWPQAKLFIPPLKKKRAMTLTERDCLRCEKPFKSAGPQFRICEACR